uniref:Uncharacterized protein n=1 Tax=Zea mays TaxID=4577 RepID=C4J0S7_MAIZE|nr:unknown [Zea mays]
MANKYLSASPIPHIIIISSNAGQDCLF